MKVIDHLFDEEREHLSNKQEKKLIKYYNEGLSVKKKTKNLSQEQLAVKAAARRNGRNREERRAFEKKYWKGKRNANNKNTNSCDTEVC